MYAFVNGIGIAAPGLENWDRASVCLAGAKKYQRADLVVPASELLPANERRRCGDLVNLALHTAHEALKDEDNTQEHLYSVFACSEGDTQILDINSTALAQESPMISPTRFHNSVHNTPAAYWSIATQNQAPSTSVSAAEFTFAAGLVEALLQLGLETDTVLFVAYDITPPPRLLHFATTQETCAIALLMARDRSPSSLARIDLLRTGNVPETELGEPGLEQLRTANPAARGLSLLAQIAEQNPATVSLRYNTNMSVTFGVESCN